MARGLRRRRRSDASPHCRAGSRARSFGRQGSRLSFPAWSPSARRPPPDRRPPPSRHHDRMRPRLEAASRRRSASATRRRGPVGRAASMPRIRSTSLVRHRIGRALEPLGMIAFHADLLGELALECRRSRASVRQSRRSPISAATRGPGAPAHCRRRGRCSGTCASRVARIHLPIPARAGLTSPAHRRAGGRNPPAGTASSR